MRWSDLNAQVRQQVADELGLYVYMLVDPRYGVPFYIGKGRGERFASHGWEAEFDLDAYDVPPKDLSSKTDQIQKIRDEGLEPDIWILRYGMKSDAEYTAVEAACIDLLYSMPISPRQATEDRLPLGNKEGLTNERREAARGHGIIRLEDLVDDLAAPRLEYGGPLLMIRLGPWNDTKDDPEKMPGGWCRQGYGYKAEWLPSRERVKHYQEIGESACGWWNVRKDRVENIEYFVAVHRGVTRGLFRIVPGSLKTHEYHSNDSGRVKRRISWEFEIVDSGEDFDHIVGPHGHRVEGIKQNSFYWPW